MRLLRGSAAISVLVALVFVAGCGGGPAAQASATPTTGTPARGQEGRVVKSGDTISVHYTGTLDDGKQFDSSRGREPLTFTAGTGQLIAGFDRAVIGLRAGESVKVHIEPKDAYGERRPDLIVNVPAAQAPPGLSVGQRIRMGNTPVVVTAVTADAVTVDANHALAGQALNFDIELVSIKN